MGAKRGIFGALLALVAGAWLARKSGDLPEIEPSIGPMDAEGGFKFAVKPNKTRVNVSGIAFTRPGLAFLAFDEGLEGRFAKLSETRYVAYPAGFPLRADGGEVDAEAAATDGHFLYVTGSHSTKRKGGDNEDSRTLVRFTLGDDGTPERTFEGAVIPAERGDILPAIRAEKPLALALGQPLGDGARLNIEGMALAGGRLYFGFRGPTEGEQAFVLSVDAAAAFAGGDLERRLHRVTVGAGRGIRDMIAVEGGFLLLAGPDDQPANQGLSYLVIFWDGGDGARPLAKLALPSPRAGDDNVKPETIAVTAVSAKSYRVVILCDGMVDGGPMWFDVPR